MYRRSGSPPGVGPYGAQDRVGRDRRHLDLGAGAWCLDDHSVAEVHRHMGGFGEVHDQVTGAQLAQRDVVQPRPLLLAGPRDRCSGPVPGHGGQARAVVRRGALRAPFVRLPELLHREAHRAVALGGGLGVVAERAGRHEPLLLLGDPALLELRQRGQLLGGERGEELLDGVQPLAHVVPLLLLPLREGGLLVQGRARPPRQFVGLLLDAGQAAHRVGPLPCQLPDHVPLVEGVPRVARQQQPQIGERSPLARYCCRASRPAAPRLSFRKAGSGPARRPAASPRHAAPSAAPRCR